MQSTIDNIRSEVFRHLNRSAVCTYGHSRLRERTATIRGIRVKIRSFKQLKKKIKYIYTFIYKQFTPKLRWSSTALQVMIFSNEMSKCGFFFSLPRTHTHKHSIHDYYIRKFFFKQIVTPFINTAHIILLINRARISMTFSFFNTSQLMFS